MAATTTRTGELTNMTVQDLRKEIRSQRDTVHKLRMGVQLGKEKNSAEYLREKRQLARMLTVLNSKNTQKTSSKSAK